MNNPASRSELTSQQPEIISNHLGETVALRYDVQPLLEAQVGIDWQERIVGAVQAGDFHVRSADGHYTNREFGSSSKFGLITALGDELIAKVPGLWALYNGPFKDMMNEAMPNTAEPLKAYADPKLAFEGYSQKPAAEVANGIEHRMEAHVDQRYTVVLAVVMPTGDNVGGRLVIGNNPDARNVDEIKRDATFITHIPGTVLCFSKGMILPHYTEEIDGLDAQRVVVSINYPVESESLEEAETLLRHIEG
jgi:hypothetical protein